MNPVIVINFFQCYLRNLVLHKGNFGDGILGLCSLSWGGIGGICFLEVESSLGQACDVYDSCSPLRDDGTVNNWDRVHPSSLGLTPLFLGQLSCTSQNGDLALAIMDGSCLHKHDSMDLSYNSSHPFTVL